LSDDLQEAGDLSTVQRNVGDLRPLFRFRRHFIRDRLGSRGGLVHHDLFDHRHRHFGLGCRLVERGHVELNEPRVAAIDGVHVLPRADLIHAGNA